MFYRRRSPWWHGLIALIAILTLPFWLAGLLWLFAVACGGNIFPLIIVMFLALYAIAEL